MVIRPAARSDAPSILRLIRELADFERSLDEVEATLEDVEATLFGAEAVAECHVAEVEGEVVGLAVWFLNYSTWLAQPGIYLEDLYVQPTFRGRGIGKALLQSLAALCVDRGYRRLQWSVLDWNRSAIDFYEGIGASALDEWTTFRLHGDALHTFGRGTA